MRVLLIGVMLLSPAAACAQTAQTAHAAQTDPASLPARDRHEGLLVAADPYTDAARTKDRFGKADPLQAGIVPIEVFFRNETAQPMRIDLSTIRLEIEPPGGSRQRLEALSADDVAGAIAHPGGAPNASRSRIPSPIPLPRHDKKQEKVAEILRPLAVQSDVVPPSSTIHGFVFFDVNHDFSLLANASLYVPDVKPIGARQPLTYFELDLRRAAHH
jgi:hypothetical protein